MAEKERDGERERQSDIEREFAGSAAAGVSASIQCSQCYKEKRSILFAQEITASVEEDWKMDRAQLYPHLWKTRQDKGGGGGGERGKASKSLRACVSLCMCVRVCVYALLPCQHGCIFQSFVWSSFQHHNHACCRLTLSDCSNQYNLKLWLILILSRHGEPFSSACLEGMAL